MFNKPNYIDQKFVEATNNGWIDNRTGEILVAVPRMLDRIKAMKVEAEQILEEVEIVTTKEVELPVVQTVAEELVTVQPIPEDVITGLIAALNTVKESKITNVVIETAGDNVIETTGDLVINLTEQNVSIESKNEDEKPVEEVKKRRGRPAKNKS